MACAAHGGDSLIGCVCGHARGQRSAPKRKMATRATHSDGSPAARAFRVHSPRRRDGTTGGIGVRAIL